MGILSILLNKYVLGALALGLACAGSFFWGHHTAYEAALVRQQAAVIAAQKAADKAIADAQARGDALQTQLQSALGKNAQLLKEKQDVIPTLTTGRTQCFSAQLVSVLNTGAAGSGVPQATGKPAPENAPAVAASDRDVATYVAAAQSQYAECAGRLNTLIDWFAKK